MPVATVVKPWTTTTHDHRYLPMFAVVRLVCGPRAAGLGCVAWRDNTGRTQRYNGLRTLTVLNPQQRSRLPGFGQHGGYLHPRIHRCMRFNCYLFPPVVNSVRSCHGLQHSSGLPRLAVLGLLLSRCRPYLLITGYFWLPLLHPSAACHTDRAAPTCLPLNSSDNCLAHAQTRITHADYCLPHGTLPPMPRAFACLACLPLPYPPSRTNNNSDYRGFLLDYSGLLDYSTHGGLHCIPLAQRL